MSITVGTFNLNNLFSRFNFRADIAEDLGGDGEDLEATYTFSDPTRVRLRRYRGKLVKGKGETGRGHVARRLLGTHLWLSPALADHHDGAWIMRRSTHSGQGSDHDPALVRLSI